MASFKIIKNQNRYRDTYSYQDVGGYICNPEKTRPDGIISTNAPPSAAITALETVSQAFHKDSGPRLRHMVLSFDPDEHVDFDVAHHIACRTMDFYADNYQMLSAIHENTDCLHIHFLMNTVNYHTGHKLHASKREYKTFLNHVKKVTERHHIHTITYTDDIENA